MKWISIFVLMILNSCTSTPEPEESLQYIKLTISKNDISEELIIEETLAFQGATYYDSQHQRSQSTYGFYQLLDIPYDSIGFTNAMLFNSSGLTPNHMSIEFPGKSIGKYEWDSHNIGCGIRIIRTLEEGLGTFIYPDGNIQVDAYGDIDDRIEGSIQGQIIDLTSSDTLQVNGTFSFIRGIDNGMLE